MMLLTIELDSPSRVSSRLNLRSGITPAPTAMLTAIAIISK